MHLLLIHIQCLLMASPLVAQWAQANLFTIDGPITIGLTLNQMLISSGFEPRTYEVVSPDGYITTVTRIVNPKQPHVANSTTAPTVVIHHGISENIISPQMGLCFYTEAEGAASTRNATSKTNSGPMSQNLSTCSDQNPLDDLLAGGLNLSMSGSSAHLRRHSSAPQCLILYLSNNNYDVWLFEARGTSPGTTKHVNKFIKKYDYWNYNIEDQALNDVPAQIAKVQEITGKKKVAYIGYSISTSYIFILLSMRPEFEQNLSAVICVAPVAITSHVRGLARLAANLVPKLGNSLNVVNIPFVGSLKVTRLINGLLSVVCDLRWVATTFCRAIINSISGPDNFQNILTSPLFGHLLSPTSFKSYLHAAQWAANPVSFTRYDYYDEQINRRHYGQPLAPQYNMTNINTDRLILVRSTGNDYLSNKEDQEQLISRLPMPLYEDIIVPSSYDHFSFWIAPSSFEQVVIPLKNALDRIYKEGIE